MATINYLPRNEFEFVLDNGTVIKGQCCTYSSMLFCIKRGYKTARQYAECLDSPGLEDWTEFILSCVESVFRKNNKNKESFPYTNIDCMEWIDEIGGYLSNDFIKLWNFCVQTIVPQTEKKTEEGS